MANPPRKKETAQLSGCAFYISPPRLCRVNKNYVPATGKLKLKVEPFPSSDSAQSGRSPRATSQDTLGFLRPALASELFSYTGKPNFSPPPFRKIWAELTRITFPQPAS
jgi:hypothetical protein